MSIADKITSIEGHLTDDYEGLENLGADLTNVNKNIQNIRTCLDNIYTNLPKTTGEGSNLSLTTLKGRINVDDIKGDTTQDSTTGYNLLPLDEIAETTTNGITYSVTNGILKLNGTATAPSTIYINTNGITLASGIYSFCGIIQSGTETGVIGKYLRNSSGNVYDGGRIESLQTRTIESYENLSATIYISSGVVCNNFVIGLMLLSGTYTSSNLPSFEPYTNGASPNPTYPQDINVVTGEQEVVVQNKNLFNKDTITENQRIDPSGNKNYDGNCDLSDYIKIQPNTTYTRNITASVYECIAFYTSEKVFISRDTANSTTTSPNNAYYVRLSCYKTNLDTLQFELGSTATDYVEHQEQTKTLHLGDIELAKIGTYQDYLYKSGDKWYKKEYIKKTSSVGQFADGGIGNVFYTTYITDYATTNNIPYSQYYTGVSNVNGASGMESQATNTIGFINQSGSVTPRFYIKDSRYTHTQVSELNTWLASNPLTLYYVLATANDIEITDTQLVEQLNEIEKMMSYNGQTNISVSGNLPMILDIAALKGE